MSGSGDATDPAGGELADCQGCMQVTFEKELLMFPMDKDVLVTLVE